MNFHEDKSISFKPINILVVLLSIALTIFIILYLVNLNGASSLRNESRIIQKQKDSLLNRVKLSRPKEIKDSIYRVSLERSIQEKDSLLNVVNDLEQHYRNKWYQTYKKLQNAQNNYNNASRRERDSLAAILAKRQY